MTTDQPTGTRVRPENTPIELEPENSEDYESENSGDFDIENDIILRAKWTYDGAKTLDEVIDRLHGQIEYIKKLQEEGWELIDTIDDDYGFLKKKQ